MNAPQLDCEAALYNASSLMSTPFTADPCKRVPASKPLAAPPALCFFNASSAGRFTPISMTQPLGKPTRIMSMTDKVFVWDHHSVSQYLTRKLCWSSTRLQLCSRIRSGLGNSVSPAHSMEVGYNLQAVL